MLTSHTYDSAHRVIQRELNFRKVCARWVPKQLTEEDKRKRVEICQTLFDRYNNESKVEFLNRIVTGDVM